VEIGITITTSISKSIQEDKEMPMIKVRLAVKY